MLDIVLDYQNLLDNLDSYIEKSKFKREYFFKELDLPRSTFYNKLKKQSFSISEMVKLSTILFPEDIKAYEIKQGLSRGKKDIAEGRIREHSNVISDARKRIN